MLVFGWYYTSTNKLEKLTGSRLNTEHVWTVNCVNYGPIRETSSVKKM